MIRIESLSYSYDGSRNVLENISLEVRRGEFISLIGPNGCGKSTLMRLMNGLLTPCSGCVTVDGIDTKSVKELPRVRQLVGMVFQNPDTQIVGMTVEEDVAFGPGNLGLPPAEIRRRVDRSLERAGILELASRAPHSLSSGEKQLVAVSGVLAMEPGYLILDEATAYLDPAGKGRVLEVVSELNREGIAVIHVTHHMDDAAKAGRVIVMAGNGILMDGPPAEVFGKAGILAEHGLTTPAAAGLAERLREAGLPIPDGVLTMEDAGDEIIRLFTVESP